MIILKSPMNRGGVIVPTGTRLTLPPDIEKAMIEAGNADGVPDAKSETKTPAAKDAKGKASKEE